LALLRRLYAHCEGVGTCANSRDDALARPGSGRGERGRGSSRGSPDERASGPGIRLSSPPCTEAAGSSADDADYADRGGITFGSTCTCGAVPEPCLPLLRGEASSTNGGVPALDCRTRDPVVLVVSADQLSAPHHAECPRSDRWILAKTKSLLTPFSRNLPTAARPQWWSSDHGEVEEGLKPHTDAPPGCLAENTMRRTCAGLEQPEL